MTYQEARLDRVVQKTVRVAKGLHFQPSSDPEATVPVEEVVILGKMVAVNPQSARVYWQDGQIREERFKDLSYPDPPATHVEEKPQP